MRIFEVVDGLTPEKLASLTVILGSDLRDLYNRLDIIKKQHSDNPNAVIFMSNREKKDWVRNVAVGIGRKRAGMMSILKDLAEEFPNHSKKLNSLFKEEWRAGWSDIPFSDFEAKLPPALNELGQGLADNKDERLSELGNRLVYYNNRIWRGVSSKSDSQDHTQQQEPVDPNLPEYRREAIETLNNYAKNNLDQGNDYVKKVIGRIRGYIEKSDEPAATLIAHRRILDNLAKSHPKPEARGRVAGEPAGEDLEKDREKARNDVNKFFNNLDRTKTEVSNARTRVLRRINNSNDPNSDFEAWKDQTGNSLARRYSKKPRS